jgi:acyl-CoA thioesterase I
LNRRHFNWLAALTVGLGAWPIAQSQTSAERTVLVLGDSLSAEYGLKRGTGWVALLAEKIKNTGGWRVVNASVSGDTTSGGRSRLGALLAQHRPAIVVIELGGNDALRGLPLTMTRDNLAAMTRQSQSAGAKVLLLGMQMPPNYGAQYGQAFQNMYKEVSQQHKTGWVPFFLKNVADAAQATALFQADRIHPNESAQAQMLANVWPELNKLLTER